MNVAKDSKRATGALGFFHPDGLAPAWKQAMNFIGKGGRLATLPDIVDARIAFDGKLFDEDGFPEEEAFAWKSYFTTASAEYAGVSKGGNNIIIVAHGIGPMATLEGMLKAYSYQFKDKTRSRRGGRIGREEFLKLESGHYGPVSIVSLDEATKWNRYPFDRFMTLREADTNPLIQARLGSRWAEYLGRHDQISKDEVRRSREDKTSPRHIIRCSEANNSPYDKFLRLGKDEAFAHLLSISGLERYSLMSFDYPGVHGDQLVCDVSCHEWSDGVRLAGIRASGNFAEGIRSGPDIEKIFHAHWPELMRRLNDPQPIGFRKLTRIGNCWFTERLKMSNDLDTEESEHLVTSMEVIGEPAIFRTPIVRGPFFMYDLKQVIAMAPQGANAYQFADDPEVERNEGGPNYHVAKIQFYKVTVDHTRRLIGEKELLQDYDTLLKLHFKD